MKPGDKVKYTPKDDLAMELTGIIMDTVTSTTGNLGYNVYVQQFDYTYRLWQNKGNFEVIE